MLQSHVPDHADRDGDPMAVRLSSQLLLGHPLSSGRPFPAGSRVVAHLWSVNLARYVHFDVRVSRRSRKQIQSFSSELIRFSARSPQPFRSREHINRFSESSMKWDFFGSRA